MHDEADFLRKLLENPADDTVRLVFADWLDERGDEESRAKARFLRLTAQSSEPDGLEVRREELHPLAAKLPTDWLAVVSRLRVDYCGAKVAADARENRFLAQFEFVCDQEWDEMTPTGDAAVRHCEQCKEKVHYCDTITVAREHAQQRHCIAVDLGIIRHGNDLAPRRWVRGKPRADFWQREEERLSVDEVSRKREERTRQNATDESTN